MVLGVVCASEFKLPSSKVIHLLGCMALGESTHLLAASQCSLPLGESVLGDQLVEAFYGSLSGLGFSNASYFLTAGSCLITPSYHATHERWNGSATLCVILAWVLWLTPCGECPSLLLGFPPRTLVVCLESDQSGHRSPVSGHGILPEQLS